MTKKATTLLLLSMFLVFAVQAQTTGDLPTQLDSYLQKAARNGWSGSALVASEGQILIEKGYGMADREAQKPQTAETVFSVGSITKQFTAAAIMKLEAMGKLSVEDLLSKYFPEAPEDKAAITLHQLLTHSAGFPPALGDDYENLNADQFAKLAFGSELVNAPGQEHLYSNVGYSLLGIIVEKVSGMGYEAFLREHLWLPAGMTRTGYLLPGFRKEELAVGYRNGERWGTAIDRPWLSDGPGWHLRANGGVLSTVGDMHRWYKALKDNTVLPKSATDKMFEPHIAEGPAELSFYGYGWVVQEMGGQKLIWHNGGNGVYNANMSFMPETNLCIVVSSNSNNKISDDIAMRLMEIMAGDASTLEEGVAERFNGEYRLPSGASFQMHIDENDRLRIKTTDKEAYRSLVAEGTEKAEETQLVAKRTLTMLENTRKGRYELFAEANGISPEEAENQAKIFWEEEEANFGKFQSAEEFCVVSRKERGLMLAFIKLQFEKKADYAMFVWEGEALADIRFMETPDKEFEHFEGMAFHAPSNDLTIVLSGKGKPSAILHLKEGEVKAKRVRD